MASLSRGPPRPIVAELDPENIAALRELIVHWHTGRHRSQVLDMAEAALWRAYYTPDAQMESDQDAYTLVRGARGTENFRQMMSMISFLREKDAVLVPPGFYGNMRA